MLENLVNCMFNFASSDLNVGCSCWQKEKIDRNFGEKVLSSNILKISSVFPQHDGPQTAINNRLVVEMILFIILGWEERIQLYKKEEKTKM